MTDTPNNVVQLHPAQPPQPTALERWQELARTFPSVARAASSPGWPSDKLSPGSLDAYLGTVHAHSGLRWAASFLLELWRPGQAWHHAPRWSPAQALGAWDSDHVAAWRRWCVAPILF